MAKPKVNINDILIGKRLRLRRIYLGISQQSLGKELKVSTQQIQKYETGKNRISLNKLPKLCEILNVDNTFFFEQGAWALLKTLELPENEDDEKELVALIKFYKQIPDKNTRVGFIKFLMGWAKNTNRKK